jgi:hypothetical protein
MSFPTGWTHTVDWDRDEWERNVEPTAAELAHALMTLPAATIISYRSSNYGDVDQVTHISYDPHTQEAVLS